MAEIIKMGTPEENAKVISKLDAVKTVSPIKVTLDGVEYSLVYDMNAFAELEQKYGTIDIALNKASTPSFQDMRTFLWAGLLHDTCVQLENGDYAESTLSEFQIGRLIKPKDLKSISESIWMAITRDLQTESTGDEGKN